MRCINRRDIQRSPDRMGGEGERHHGVVVAAGARGVRQRSFNICLPEYGDQADRMTDAAGRPASPGMRWNFRSPANLSYSYDSPFTDALKQAFSGDRLREECAVLADRNPGFDRDGDRVLGPAGMRRRLSWQRGIHPITSTRGRMCCIHRGMFRLNGRPIAGLATTIFIRRKCRVQLRRRDHRRTIRDISARRLDRPIMMTVIWCRRHEMDRQIRREAGRGCDRESRQIAGRRQLFLDT